MKPESLHRSSLLEHPGCTSQLALAVSSRSGGLAHAFSNVSHLMDQKRERNFLPHLHHSLVESSVCINKREEDKKTEGKTRTWDEKKMKTEGKIGDAGWKKSHSCSI